MATDLFHFEQFDSFSPYTDVGPYRAADYWKLPEGELVELIRGRLIMSPSPALLHQMIVGHLYQILQEAANNAEGLTVVSPMDVVFSDDTILQPDLFYIAKDRRHIVSDRVNGPPDLVIEIISPGSDRRDRTEKLDLYAKYGVAEYWIVEPSSQLFEFLILDQGRYDQGRYVVTQSANNRYQSPRLPELEIDLAAFWKEVERRLPKK